MKNQSGQVALIVLLVSAITMTIGLSLSRKTVTETKIDTDQELLKQAFNAAESGVDYYLGTGKTEYTAPDERSKADVVVNEIGGGTSIDSGGLVLENNTFLFWLSSHNDDGSIGNTFYIGNYVDICVDAGFTGALKIDYFYKNATGNYKIERKGFYFGGSAPSGVSGFNPKIVTTRCSGNSTRFTLTGAVPLLIAIKPIGGNTSLSLKSELTVLPPFPLQGQEISSTGRAGDLSTAGVNRKVTVLNRYKIPSFLLEAITAHNEVTSE